MAKHPPGNADFHRGADGGGTPSIKLPPAGSAIGKSSGQASLSPHFASSVVPDVWDQGGKPTTITRGSRAVTGDERMNNRKPRKK